MKSTSKSDGGTSKTPKKFQYKGKNRTVETISRNAKVSGGSFDSPISQGVQMYKPREGENNIRLLPLTWDDTKKWGDGWQIFVEVHYGIGPDNSSYLCNEKMEGEPCPICAARAETNDEDEKSQLRTNKRALCWVIDRDNEKAGPMAWLMPLALFRDINGRSVDKKTNQPILLDDPEEGFDLTFIKEGTGLHTKYSGVEIARDPSLLSEKPIKAERWLAFAAENPLPSILNYYDEEHLEKVLSGKSSHKKAEDDEDEDDEDEKPARKRGAKKTPAKRGKAKDEDEEDEDDGEEEETKDDEDEDPDSDENGDEDEDGDDEDDASKDDDEDDDDDDEDDEDEEEDEKPVKGKARGQGRPPVNKAKVKAKTSVKKSRTSDDDDDDEDDEDEEEDEDNNASSRAKQKLELMKKRRAGGKR